MNDQVAMHMASQAMLTTVKVAAPILISAMVVGLVVSLFQSVTQIQEVTLTFVPKLIVVGLVITFAGNWMLGQFIGYVDELFRSLPQLLGSG
ncbi:MAG TPA: flagellar biosynthesis protein FliQ [Acidimicrobiales bacterium]|nr:flagellar biosynthesis protein FliQ [Acidimicrobiales bacterium]